MQWMLLTAGKPLDFHAILKTAYFADKRMLNEYWRPIFGATYRAMNYGPVPLEIYEMLKCEPYWLSELDLQDYPWKRVGHQVELIDSSRRDEILNPSHIAAYDMAILEKEFERSLGMTFNERTEETHLLDWVRGTERPNELMAYEDMIDDNHPIKEEIIKNLLSEGLFLVL
ncbi:MAG: SocA family protein [Gammaproteobacteria bacterium AqS3]|nr:SocA family protein [Gammaproteobacteria bacterium AqS3]